MCPDRNCENGNVPVDNDSEAIGAASVNASTETASDNCSADEQQIEETDVADRQAETAVSVSSQCQSNKTTASAAFYCHPGTDCYESFGDVVKNANKTSKLIELAFHDALMHVVSLPHSHCHPSAGFLEDFFFSSRFRT